MPEPEVILEEVSPAGNICAVVEQTEDVCHFYLFGEPESAFGVRSCWVRNFGPAPDKLSAEEMQEGRAPALPRKYCAHPDGAPRFQSGELEVVWAEEGDAAALRHRDGALLAIIPAWSGQGGFHGYARDCVSDSPLAWPLGTPEQNVQFARVQRADAFWKQWEEGGGPWPALQRAQIEAIEAALGTHTNYYAIDGEQWPPKALLKIPERGRTVGISVGVSLRPQPGVEAHFEDPSLYRRIELGLALDTTFADLQITSLLGGISAMTAVPWKDFTFFGPGHTISAGTLAEVTGGRFTSYLLLHEGLGIPPVSLPPFREDPVRVLWLIPITAEEQSFAEETGSSELLEKLEEAGVSWIASLDRPAVL